MPQIPLIQGIGTQGVMRYPFFMEAVFYVYCHLRNDTGEVFYIGKGKGRRAYASKPYNRSQWWLHAVESAGGFSVKFLHEGLLEAEAFKLEIDEISRHRAMGVKLVNLTDGGDGTSGHKRSDEWRAMMSSLHKGKTISLEVRQKISHTLKNSGYVMSEETRIKRSRAHLGHKRNLGRKQTDEWKEKSKTWTVGNKSRTGQTRGPEERAKASAALRGRVQTVITCPHCNKSGGNIMRRYHFDNCKVIQNGAN